MTGGKQKSLSAIVKRATGVIALLIALVGMTLVQLQSGEITVEIATAAMYFVAAYGLLMFSVGHAVENSGFWRRFWTLLGHDFNPTNAGEKS